MFGDETMKASVIICTYNRSAMLGDSIRAIRSQDFPSHAYEIIVVDNNSTDNTQQVVEALQSDSQVEIRYLFESRQGLSFARNSGIQAARGEVVAFVDDDIDAEKFWLKEVVDAFSPPDVACVGGPIRPVWLTEKPDWLTEEWYGYLSVSEFASARSRGEFVGPEYPWGANIAFRRSVINEIGGFPTNLGRIGTTLLSGEEVALCMKIEEQGYRIGYAPNAIIHHKIPPERLRKRWYYRRTYWHGRSDAVLNCSNPSRMEKELRRYTNILRMGFNADNPHSFEARCYRRVGIGFFHQMFLCLYGETKVREYNALRALFCIFHESSKGIVVLRENEDELMAIRNSLSWRLTAPIRLLLDSVTGQSRRK